MQTQKMYAIVRKSGALLACAWILFSGSAAFSTEVSGEQSGIWTLTASPYVVTGNLVVPAGRTLTIQPGVVVQFSGAYSMAIEGALYAIGGASSLIIFTSTQDSEFGAGAGQSSRPAALNDWVGLVFRSGSSGSRLENIMLRYCTQPLVVNQASPSLQKITILDCAANTLLINGRPVFFRNGVQATFSTTLSDNSANPENAAKPSMSRRANKFPYSNQSPEKRVNTTDATRNNNVTAGATDRVGARKTGAVRNLVSAFTMSQVNDILKNVSTQAALRADPELSEKFNLFDQSYLVHLTNHLDFNYIGAGRTVSLNPEAMIAFIIEKLESGIRLNSIGLELVAEFERKGFRTAAAPGAAPSVDLTQAARTPDLRAGFDTKIGKVNIGGFLVGEVEYHQEPNGEFLTLLEVNQARIYFATAVNPFDAANNISVLAEFNPVPEEIIHQIDEISFALDGGTIILTPPVVETEEGVVPFEQLFLKIQNLGNSGFGVTVGQFRNPFGLWSDFTSHRNFTSAKNNVMVNGFALKKIELGVMLERVLNENVEFRAALVHGRQGRTSGLSRADNDNKKDLVGRIGLNAGRMRLGASGYLGEFSLKRNFALGLDWLYSISRLSIGGELVYQKNNDVNQTFGTDFDFSQVSATSGYLQFNYALNNKLHLYGLYEIWRYTANGEVFNNPAYKVFHGMRYHLHPQLRWTFLEFGRMFHAGFDEGDIHLSTQIEVIF